MESKAVLFNPYSLEHRTKLKEFENTSRDTLNISHAILTDINSISKDEYKQKLEKKEIRELNIFTVTNDVFTMGAYLEMNQSILGALDVEFLSNRKSNYERDLPLLIEMANAINSILLFKNVIYQFKKNDTVLIRVFIDYLKQNNFEIFSEVSNGNYIEFIIDNDYVKGSKSTTK
ncbi:MAG: hypothetical protein RSE91_01470 [Bacilli bacterium]